MHPLANFLDWHGSTFVCIPDPFVNGCEGFFILLIEDGSRVFEVMFLRLGHMLNSIPIYCGMQSECPSIPPRQPSIDDSISELFVKNNPLDQI